MDWHIQDNPLLESYKALTMETPSINVKYPYRKLHYVKDCTFFFISLLLALDYLAHLPYKSLWTNYNY